jgi:riboflavin biosynthesis pyrimidine reductase
VSPPLQPLWELAPTTDQGGASRTIDTPAGLVEFYGGPLVIPLRRDRPTLVANFVSTLDGVVSFGIPGAAGGGAISGHFPPDKTLMGMLRAASDAVLVGAGTVRASARGEWTPRHADPSRTEELEACRRALRLSAQPLTCVVTASGDVDVSRPGLSRPDVPVLVLTTERGLAALALAPASSERLAVAVAGVDDVPAEAIVGELAQRGAELVVCEGGPHLLATLMAAGLIDELFLTVAPQVAGREPGGRRPGLVEGLAFPIPDAPWAELVSARRAASHLFLRYRFNRTVEGDLQ